MRLIKKQKIKALFLFFISFGFGFAVIYSIIDQIAIQRDPASIKVSSNYFSKLSPDQLKNEIHKKVKIQPIVDSHNKLISFQGFSSYLCKSYKTVELEFYADGISINGEPATMKVVADCLPALDPTEMASVIIPVDELIVQKFKSGEYVFAKYTTKIQFSQAAEEWPKTWILNSVHFKSINLQESKIVNLDHQLNNGHAPIVIEF